MTDSPTIAVVICAFTEARWDRLLAAVGSVAAQSRPASETILVIDHNDTLLARAREAVPGVRVLANDAPDPGLSGGRNTGTLAASAEVIAFLDDDAVAAPDWLERLAAPYAEAEVVGAGGRIDPVWATGRPAWWPSEFDWVVGCTYRGMPEAASDVRNVIGANMSFRRSAILAGGGFDVATGRGRGRPLGGEETELAIRLASIIDGARIRYEPDAAVAHAVPADRASFRYFVRRCYAEGLSKARVARLAGRGQGLASERRYATRVLPAGVLRELGSAARHLDPAAIGRAAAIAIGLLVTTAGYALGGRSRDAAIDRTMTGADAA